MRLTREAREQWRENWDQAREAKDQRRLENPQKWNARRDWSDDSEHKSDAVVEDIPSAGGGCDLKLD
jgi:hypothetical protein